MKAIELITAIVALIAACVSFGSSCGNRSQIANQEKAIIEQREELNRQREELNKQMDEIQRIRALATNMATSVSILAPLPEQELPAIYSNMNGKFSGNIPSGHSFWVLANNGYSYYLMYPQTQILHATGKWKQTNIRLGSTGSWQLSICIGNDKASEWLRKRAESEDWTGFSDLPEGLEIMQVVQVDRI